MCSSDLEEKNTLMRKMGKKRLTVTLNDRLETIPPGLSGDPILSPDGIHLTYTFDSAAEHSGIPELLKNLSARGIEFKDLQSKESSLEEIFVNLVHK